MNWQILYNKPRTAIMNSENIGLHGGLMVIRERQESG